MSVVIPVLNKTYTDNSAVTVGLNGSTKTIFESKEFTIQGNKAFNITVQAPYAPTQTNFAHWAGVYIASSMKVNGVWYDLGNSGYAMAMALSKVRTARYYDCKYIDLIGDTIVPANTDYKIIVRLRGRTYGSHGDINSASTSVAVNQVADSGNRGLGIQEVMDQNWTSIIIQEKDRS